MVKASSEVLPMRECRSYPSDFSVPRFLARTPPRAASAPLISPCPNCWHGRWPC